MVNLFANSGDSNQTLQSVASNVGLHCLIASNPFGRLQTKMG